MPNSSRNILLDVLKIVASLFIVAFHSDFLREYNKFFHYVTFQGILRWVIPFFFCVTGFFLYRIFEKGQFKDWNRRIGILYAVWMLIFGYFWIVPNYNSPYKLLLNIVIGFNHLWYVASLFVGGFLLYRVRNLSNKTLLIGAIILYIIGYSIQALGDLALIKEPEIAVKLVNFTPTHRNFLLFDLPFLILGYTIRRSNFYLLITKGQIIALFVLGFVLLTVESILNYYYNVDRSLSIISLACFIVCPAILLIALRFSIHSKIDSKLLSLYSIAIYLVHPLIIIFLRKYIILESISFTLMTIALTVLVSYVLIQLNKKLKYIL